MASVMGGIQIAHTGTSLPHGMGYPLTYFRAAHGLANGVLTIEFLKSFKEQRKIDRMLNILEFRHLAELEAVFNCLIDVKIDITEDEIYEYSGALLPIKIS